MNLWRLIFPQGPEDWVVEVQVRDGARTYPRVIGITANNEQAARYAAWQHIRPKRQVLAGTAPEILDMRLCRMHEWKARRYSKHGSETVRRQVAEAQKG